MGEFYTVFFMVCTFLGYSMSQVETTRRYNETAAPEFFKDQGKDQPCLNNNETEAIEFLERYDNEYGILGHDGCVAAFNYVTNMTDYNANILSQLDMEDANLTQRSALEASKFDVSDNSSLSNDTIRQLKFIQDMGTAAQTNLTKLERLNTVSMKLLEIYGAGNVCLTKDQCFDLNSGLNRIMEESRDFDELLAVWKGWRDSTGPKMKHLYEEYTNLTNDALAISGYSDAGEYWRSAYETPTFEEDIRQLYEQIRPLYEQLHGYVRKRLISFYGHDKFPSTGHIPAHLLGNMWAQQWERVIDKVLPNKGRLSLDVTDEMVKQNYTVKKMFRTAESFYTSLGFESMLPSYWKKSMFKKPTDGRVVECQPSALDCRNSQDFRIKMCANVTHQDLMTAHHEMGHTVYAMAYRDQPQVYKDGANPGFHEAIGDVMTLSAQTPDHLKSIGLLGNFSDDKDTDIYFLMNMALKEIALLPFEYLIDHWRWSVFRGDTKPEDYNKHWWQLRCRFQGVSSPVPRSDNDFDPGAKHHVASGTPTIRYFVASIIKFQFHKAACDVAGYEGPLHRCDIYNSTEAGDLFRKMLEMGRSKPWPVAMEVMTGQRKMNAGAILDYFQPLFEFLRKKNGNDYGWNPQCPEFDTKAKGREVEKKEIKCDNINNGVGKEQLQWYFRSFLSFLFVLIIIL